MGIMALYGVLYGPLFNTTGETNMRTVRCRQGHRVMVPTGVQRVTCDQCARTQSVHNKHLSSFTVDDKTPSYEAPSYFPSSFNDTDLPSSKPFGSGGGGDFGGGGASATYDSGSSGSDSGSCSSGDF